MPQESVPARQNLPLSALQRALEREGKLSMDDKILREGPPRRWNPPDCGTIDMRIRTDGAWLYQGSSIDRPAMVKLFARILRREANGGYYLVTPVEKLRITVEDAPFIAQDLQVEDEGRRIVFRTNLEDEIVASAMRPIRMQNGRPYVLARAGLDALIDRKTFMRLAELATPGPQGMLGVRSMGAFFPLADAQELADAGLEA